MTAVQKETSLPSPAVASAFKALGPAAQMDLTNRRLSAKLLDTEAKLAETLVREEQLSAAFANSLRELDKILASRTMRAARTFRKVVGVTKRLLMPFWRRKGTNAVPEVSPTEEPTRLDQVHFEKEQSYHDWALACLTLSTLDQAAIMADIASLRVKPKIDILIRDHEGDPAGLEHTLASLRKQLYPHWELYSNEREFIRGTYLTVLQPGDRLPEHALYEVVREFNDWPDAAMVYTDEDRITDQDRLTEPVFKPDFNIDLQLAIPFTGALSVFRCSMLEILNVATPGLVATQQQTLPLLIADKFGAKAIRHIPSVLCHRPSKYPFPIAADSHALFSPPAEVVNPVSPIAIAPLPDHPQWNRVTWPLPKDLPLVSVIIPTRDRADLLARAVLGLLYRTDYPDLEIIILDNESTDPTALALFRLLRADKRVRVISVPDAFNYSALNNAGVRQASGEILLLLNNDIDVIEPDWLREMVSHALRPDVGAVGAKLLYGDGRIQHAGVVLGVGQHNGGPGVAGHFGLGAEPGETGYLGQFAVTRELSAVTGACLAVRREVYEAVGGFEERWLPISFNDVDFCLRLRQAGFRIIWTPYAVLYHLESATRGGRQTDEQIAQAAREADYMREKWSSILDNDPFYNPAFDRKSHAFERAVPPFRRRSWSA